MLEFTGRYKGDIEPSIIMPRVKWSAGQAAVR